MTLTLMFWNFSLVDSVPLDCWILQMYIPVSSLCISSTFRLPLVNWMNLLPWILRPSFLIHLNWGAGFPRALHCIMPGFPLMNVCRGVMCMNLAEKVKFINIIRCVCSSCGIFCNCHKKKFASLANVHHYKIMVLSGHACHKWRLCPISTSSLSCGSRMLVFFSAQRGFSPGTPVLPSHQNVLICCRLVCFFVPSISRANVLSYIHCCFIF
mgnify:CR=1 FL=1